MTAREWDGKTYDRISAPMEAMGLAVLDRLELDGDETVVDAGCGSGRVTEALIERLPDGWVIGVDGSAEMIASARERLGDRAELIVADLTELALDEPVDAIFSTATFHWIADHDALFARLRGLLKPQGRLVAQCGGYGQIAEIHAALKDLGGREPYAAHLGGWPGPWNFQTAEATTERLERLGFTDVHTWLSEEPVESPDGRDWLRTIIAGAHFDRLPHELQDPFLDDLCAAVGADPVLRVTYVRLNLHATLP